MMLQTNLFTLLGRFGGIHFRTVFHALLISHHLTTVNEFIGTYGTRCHQS